MSYFNFFKIAPPAPNDPLVNEITQINNNWDHADSKIGVLTGVGSLINPEQGQEFIFYPRTRVWTGATSRDPDDIDDFWGSWTALTLSGSVAPRVNFTPRWRLNSALRKIQLAGGLLKDAGGSAWPASLVTVTAAGAGQIGSGFTPIGNLTYQLSAAALPSGGANGSAGWHQIDLNAGIVRIQTQYMGGPGGGNFIMLDGIEWWY